MPLLVPFGGLLNAIFLCPNLSIATKRLIYRTAVISSLLYGSNTWAVNAGHIYRLEILHHSFVCAIIGISRTAEWRERLSCSQLCKGLACRWRSRIFFVNTECVGLVTLPVWTLPGFRNRSSSVSSLVPVLVMARRIFGATSLLVTWCFDTSRSESGTCWHRIGASGGTSIALLHLPLPWSRSFPLPGVFSRGSDMTHHSKFCSAWQPIITKEFISDGRKVQDVCVCVCVCPCARVCVCPYCAVVSAVDFPIDTLWVRSSLNTVTHIFLLLLYLWVVTNSQLCMSECVVWKNKQQWRSYPWQQALWAMLCKTSLLKW